MSYREEYVSLLRTQQQRQRQRDLEMEQLKGQLAIRHFKELESLEENDSFLRKALIMRKHYLEVQNLKRSETRELMDLIQKHLNDMKQLKSKWADVDQEQVM